MYLFLDFDGVIVPEQAYFYWAKRKDKKRASGSRAERSCPIALSNLDYVCDQVPELLIVISSTWRKYYSLEDIKALLREDGFRNVDRIVAITPSIARGFNDQNGMRGTEIISWLNDNASTEDWVALDDHKYNIKEEHLVLTLQEVGFTLLQAYQVIERFNPDWQRPLFLM